MTFCVLGANCSVYDPMQRLAGVTRASPICEGCTNRCEKQLHLLKYDYLDLSQLIPANPAPSEAKIARPKPASRPPMDMNIYVLRGQIAYTLFTAADALAQFLGDTGPGWRDMREGYAVTVNVSYLHYRVPDLARMPRTERAWDLQTDVVNALSGPEVMVLFSLLHRRARKACGLDAKLITVPGYCPKCNVPSLRRADDNPGKISCAGCRHAMSEQDYLAAQRVVFTRSGCET